MVARALSRIQPDDLLARFGLAAVGGFLFATGFRIFPASSISTLATIGTLLMYGGAFLLWGFALALKSPVKPGVHAVLAVAVIVGIVASVSYGILYEIPSYGTDVMALTHAGAEVLLDGINPYSVERNDVLPILERLNLREGLFTQTVSGRPVQGVTYYPGLHVLAYTAFAALGVSDLRWATLVFELMALTFIWLAISPRSRWLIPALLLLEPYSMVIFTTGGNTDWLWALPLVVSALFLHKGRFGWAGLWLGVACAAKQQPWFAVPFVTLWAIRQVRNRNTASSTGAANALGSFFAMLGLGFFLPNLPFIMWSPKEWLQGVLGPSLLDLIPDGQGIVILTTSGLLNLTRAQLSLLALFIMAVLCFLFFVYFDRLKHLLWLLPPIVLFFAHRSLHNYFVFWLPVAAMWLDLEVTLPWLSRATSEA